MKVRPATKADIGDILGCVRRIKREYFEANNIENRMVVDSEWDDDWDEDDVFEEDEIDDW